MTEKPSKKRDLLSLADLNVAEMNHLFKRAAELKTAQRHGETVHSLRGQTLGMIFEKPSTRTRVSFEVGMYQLGGQALFLSSKDIQLGRGEALSDSARVLSRYVDGIMVRTFAHENVVILAQYATVPIINGLTDDFHPCQLLTDLFTYQEYRGSLAGRKVAWIGDGNNMAHSWILAAAKVGFNLTLACPTNYDPDPKVMARAQNEIALAKKSGNGSAPTGIISLIRDPREAAADADLVVTDTWTSMGQETERQRRLRAFSGYRVDDALMDLAARDALFMHCLPAHRGEEVTAEVLDGPRSVVFDEAENRLHVQKAVLEWLMKPK